MPHSTFKKWNSNNSHPSSLDSIKNDSNEKKNSIRCIKKSCTDDSFAILIQHIENPITFSDFLDSYISFDEEELFNILYQVYAVLDYYKKWFTHYDLHSSNVLLYKLPNSRFITMNYYNEHTNVTTTIHTRYLVKIIDYGRSYFKGGYATLAAMKKAKCFHFTSYRFHINNYTSNHSHDLRLVFSAKLSNIDALNDCRIHYKMFGIQKYTKTREIDDKTIYTVTHMVEYLESKLQSFHTERSDFKKYGTMTISLTIKHGTKPLQFDRYSRYDDMYKSYVR
jgi:hypothetical protein